MQMTRTKPDGSWSVIGSSGDVVPWKDIPKELVGVIYKLHAYEKIGLSPDTVEFICNAICKENKRLVNENARLKKLVDELQNILDGSVEIC